MPTSNVATTTDADSETARAGIVCSRRQCPTFVASASGDGGSGRTAVVRAWQGVVLVFVIRRGDQWAVVGAELLLLLLWSRRGGGGGSDVTLPWRGAERRIGVGLSSKRRT